LTVTPNLAAQNSVENVAVIPIEGRCGTSVGASAFPHPFAGDTGARGSGPRRRLKAQTAFLLLLRRFVNLSLFYMKFNHPYNLTSS